MDTNLDMAVAVSDAVEASPVVAGAIDRAREALFRMQNPAGWWWAELQSNVTITAEVVLLHRIWDTAATRLLPEAKLERYFRDEQRANGSWELFYGDGGDVSTSVEAYMGLRLLGVPASDPALVRAKAFILAKGGIPKTRIFTKLHLALCGAFDWRGLPHLPAWAMLLPGTFPVSIYQMSSWARGSTVPLMIVFDRKSTYDLLPPGALDELFPNGRTLEATALPAGRDALDMIFLRADALMKGARALGIDPFRAKGLKEAERWTLERQEATGDWSGIIPAMLNSMLALRALGYDLADPAVQRGFDAIDAFGFETETQYRVQPCVSPVWDTGLVIRALVESGVPRDDARLQRAAEWLLQKQILEVKGDWCVKNPNGAAGGWAFEFENRFYPDVDDSAVVNMALAEVRTADEARKRGAMERGAKWIASMQCKPGGWAAFDIDNDAAWLNRLPYADLRAMIDPNTADVTARVLEMHARCDLPIAPEARARAMAYLLAEQEHDGAWFGRWGVNYIYGTSGALAALSQIAKDGEAVSAMRRGALWFLGKQNADGGWGETCRSYDDPSLRGQGPSTPSQTAWALIGLLAASERLSDVREEARAAIDRGVRWLLADQRPDGTWDEREFTGTGFPSHFYLKYHLYATHFALTALGRYRTMFGA
jgi:squalene-hopene/tetraprenyl-beta-curcumene cyclase